MLATRTEGVPLVSGIGCRGGEVHRARAVTWSISLGQSFKVCGRGWRGADGELGQGLGLLFGLACSVLCVQHGRHGLSIPRIFVTGHGRGSGSNKGLIFGILTAIVSLIIASIALYMSFRRNKGFELGSFLAALIFSPLYIVYALAVPIEGVKYSLN